MAYYVLGSGGAKYGPAEVGTLNSWIGQGRIGPETLLEDAGGVKRPARAIPGLRFDSSALAAAVRQPSANLATCPAPLRSSDPNQPIVDPAMQSNYMRPGLASGGSRRNLFLSTVDANWAWHGFACVGIALLSAALIGFTHLYLLHFGKLFVFALALPIYGVQRDYIGLQFQRPLAVLVIALNLLAMLGAVVLIFKDLIF